MTRRIGLLLFFFFIFIGLADSREARGGDLEDIRTRFQAEVNAFNAHKQNAFIT